MRTVSSSSCSASSAPESEVRLRLVRRMELVALAAMDCSRSRNFRLRLCPRGVAAGPGVVSLSEGNGRIAWGDASTSGCQGGRCSGETRPAFASSLLNAGITAPLGKHIVLSQIEPPSLWFLRYRMRRTGLFVGLAVGLTLTACTYNPAQSAPHFWVQRSRCAGQHCRTR
jgi:hypothetical protein